MRKQTAVCMLFILLLGAALLLSSPGPVNAQDPTPEPTMTPTPNSQVGLALSTGNTFVIERKVTYGDVAIVLVVLLDITISLSRAFVEIPKNWLNHQ